MQMKDTLPIIVRIPVPQEKFDPDAIDTEVYCVNITNDNYRIEILPESFTTIDEESGATAAHGSPETHFMLGPGESAQAAEVAGWEWDGHVGIAVCFTNISNGAVSKRSYNLKHSVRSFFLSQHGKEGRVIPPENF